MKKITFLILLTTLFSFLTVSNPSYAQNQYECVWDQFSTPSCKLEELYNPCYQDANPDNCNAILNQTECNNATFDCPAEPSECINCGGTPTDEYPVVCPDTSICCIDSSYCPGVTPIPTYYPETCWCPPEEPDCQNYPPLNTAIGCIDTHPSLFVHQLVRIFLSIGGGIAFLIMIVGAFFILTSQGDSERTKRGKEVFFGGLIGLLIMIFGLFILTIIGGGILGLFEVFFY